MHGRASTCVLQAWLNMLKLPGPNSGHFCAFTAMFAVYPYPVFKGFRGHRVVL